MNSSCLAPATWTRGHFWGLAAALFAAQVVLLLVFAERSSSAKPPDPVRTHFFAVETALREHQLMTMFFAGDPSVFAQPNRHGFSSRAWLSQPPPIYHPGNRLETPLWLNLDVSTLGKVSLPALGGAVDPLFLDLSGQGASSLEPLPVFLPPPFVQTQSLLRLQGDLRSRLQGPISLPSQPSAQLLTNSVVELAIDQEGNVLAHRLLERSGSAAADEAALAMAKTLRFRPAAKAGAAWGEAIFEWHTIQDTNAVPPK